MRETKYENSESKKRAKQLAKTFSWTTTGQVLECWTATGPFWKKSNRDNFANSVRMGSRNAFSSAFHNDSAWLLLEKLKKHLKNKQCYFDMKAFFDQP